MFFFILMLSQIVGATDLAHICHTNVLLQHYLELFGDPYLSRGAWLDLTPHLGLLTMLINENRLNHLLYRCRLALWSSIVVDHIAGSNRWFLKPCTQRDAIIS